MYFYTDSMYFVLRVQAKLRVSIRWKRTITFHCFFTAKIKRFDLFFPPIIIPENDKWGCSAAIQYTPHYVSDTHVWTPVHFQHNWLWCGCQKAFPSRAGHWFCPIRLRSSAFALISVTTRIQPCQQRLEAPRPQLEKVPIIVTPNAP